MDLARRGGKTHTTSKMNLNGWKKNLILTVVFIIYLVIGAAIFYGIEKDAPPPMPNAMTMYMMKVMSEKQMQGIQMGMKQAVPQVTQAYKAQTGKETFDDQDVATIAEMSLKNVIEMVKAEMAKAAGGAKRGEPQASRHTATNGDTEAKPSNPEENVAVEKTDEMTTEDKTITDENENMDTEGARRKRQAENTTESTPTTTTTPPAKKEPSGPPKPGYGAYMYIVLTSVSTIGYGNLYPKTTGGQVFYMFYTTFGIPLFFYVICKIVLATRAVAIAVHSKILQVMKKEAASTCCKNLTRLLMVFITGFIVLMLVCPAIFSHVEDWTYFESMYFVFSTITTIGFGDFYPGVMMGLGDPAEVNSSVRGVYMVFVFLYMFAGISWVFTLGLMTFDCCTKKHKTKEITHTNGVSTPPKITVENEVEKNDEDLEKTAQPLLNESAKEVEMEEITKEEKPTETETETEKPTETETA